VLDDLLFASQPIHLICPDNKLADVSNGGPGTVFDTFEYTTEATAFGSPKIASGYAIVRAPGELIYRTSASDHDVSGWVNCFDVNMAQ